MEQRKGLNGVLKPEVKKAIEIDSEAPTIETDWGGSRYLVWGPSRRHAIKEGKQKYQL